MTTRNEITVDYWAIELDDGENLLDLGLGDAVELPADTGYPGLWVLTALLNDEGAVTLQRGEVVEDCGSDLHTACEYAGTRHAHPVGADGRIQPSPHPGEQPLHPAAAPTPGAAPMSTAMTPTDLVRDAEDALTAARAAADFLAAYPGLPVARMHACGADGQGRPGPLLEIQLVEGSTGIAADRARAATGAEPQQEQWLNRVEHQATVQFAGVTVLVTAFEDKAEDDEQ